MPRKRQGPPGSYENRSDLAMTRNQPVQVAPGGEYGSRQASIESQKVAPLPQTVDAPPSADGGGMATALQAALGHNFQPVGLGDPSRRPSEPVTAGLPIGAGGGPELLSPLTGPDPNSLSSLLQSLASNARSSDLQTLADLARSLGQ